MFQFGRCPPPCLCDSTRGATPYRVAGCPIRRSSDHCLVPAPRRLSQLPTSFFGTRRQGIHRMPLLPSSLCPPSSDVHLEHRLTSSASTAAPSRSHYTTVHSHLPPSIVMLRHPPLGRTGDPTSSPAAAVSSRLVITASLHIALIGTRHVVSSVVKVHRPASHAHETDCGALHANGFVGTTGTASYCSHLLHRSPRHRGLLLV